MFVRHSRTNITQRFNLVSRGPCPEEVSWWWGGVGGSDLPLIIAELAWLKGHLVTEPRPPFPPFDLDSAITKVQAAEDAWNTRDPHRVSLAYTEDSVWRNRDLFITGRAEIVAFLTAKWERELDYVLRKSLWGFRENRIAVRFQYECHDRDGQWFRSYGNELWEFDDNGLMRRREASINDVAITEAERRYFGPRPADERGIGHDIPLH